MIENSFKHGLKGDKGSNFVTISLKNTDSELQFSVSNNKGEMGHSENGKYGGIGLANVEKRLHLIYGERAKIDVTDSDKKFEVAINIKWND